MLQVAPPFDTYKFFRLGPSWFPMLQKVRFWLYFIDLFVYIVIYWKKQGNQWNTKDLEALAGWDFLEIRENAWKSSSSLVPDRKSVEIPPIPYKFS